MHEYRESLAALAKDADALKRIIAPIFPAQLETRERRGHLLNVPGVEKLLPFGDGTYVSFDVPGADAAVKFEREDGSTQLVLIGWPHTDEPEVVAPEELARRAATHADAWAKYALPVKKALFLCDASYEDLLVDPLYSILSMQLLASEMEERAGQAPADSPEHDAASVSVLFLADGAGKALTRPPLSKFRTFGPTPAKVWARLAGGLNRFATVDPATFGREWSAR